MLQALAVGQELGASGSRVGVPRSIYLLSLPYPERESLQAQVGRDISSDHGQGPGMMGPMAGLCIQQVVSQHLLEWNVGGEGHPRTQDLA